MNIINNLSLRIKLIGGFVFVALIVSSFSFLIPRFAFQRLTQDAVPFVEVMGEISTLFNMVELKALAFVSTSEQKAAREFREAAGELHVLSDQLKGNQFDILPADEAENLASLSTQMETVGQEVIQSHRETLTELKVMEAIGDELEESLEKAPEMNNSSSVQQYIDELGRAALLLEIKATEFVVTAQEKSKAEYEAAEAQLSTTREKSKGIIEIGDPGEASFIARLDDTAARMATQSRVVVESHQETLELLRRMEDTEKNLEDILARVQALSEEGVEASIDRLQRDSFLAAVGSLVLAILLGLLTTRSILTPIFQLRKAAGQIGAGNLSVRAEVNSQDEIGQLARIFNRMTDQLREMIASVEKQSQQRALILETTAEISRRLTTILDVDQLLGEVVNSIQNAFGYYHVHIYIINQTTGDLVMREGTGEVGRQLKAKGHRLKAGEGIVGKVVRSGEAFFAENVDEVPDFVRNPLLPKTQAELAVPIRKGNIILGVLDMQSEEVGSFSEQDLTLMQSIADQVAVVLENTRLFRQAQAAAVEAERLTHQLTRESWQDIGGRVSTTGYVFTKSGVTPVSVSDIQTEDEAWLPIMAESVQKKKLTYHASESDNNGQQVNCLSIPLVLRNEIIGVIGIERAVADTALGVSGKKDQKDSRRAWSEDELATIQAIAEQVALALDAARLTLETERAAWRDRVVGESIARVWATDEIEEVMKAAVTQLGDSLRASEVVIRLASEDDLLLE